MNVRQVVFSIPNGGQATLAFPEPVTLEIIDISADASAVTLRSVRRDALDPRGRDAGAIEYDSWAANSR
jgi:hypothetical protein